jgi:hypothetical protein
VSQQQDSKHDIDLPDTTRRNFLAVGSAVLATVASAGVAAPAQEGQNMREAEKDISASDPGQENRPLLQENPSSNMPPPTDHGDIAPIGYSFDLVHKRVQEGGSIRRRVAQQPAEASATRSRDGTSESRPPTARENPVGKGTGDCRMKLGFGKVTRPVQD